VEVNQKGMARLQKECITADQVAETVFEAVRKGQFYFLTHPQYNCMVNVRMEDIVHRRNPTNL
jgi:hypothetical protein